MSTVANTERPKLKLNFGAKPLALNTNGGALIVGSTLKKVVVFEKPKSDVKDEAIGVTQSSSKADKKSKKQAATASNKEVASSSKAAANQKVVSAVPTPEEILKEKIKW